MNSQEFLDVDGDSLVVGLIDKRVDWDDKDVPLDGTYVHIYTQVDGWAGQGLYIPWEVAILIADALIDYSLIAEFRNA